MPEDRALLSGFRRADPEALERIYHAHVSEVAGFLRRGFGFSSQGKEMRFTGYDSPDDLQDALQESFMLAFSESARMGYDGLTPFGRYLLGIARNVVLGHFRKNLSRLNRFRPIEPVEGEMSSSGEAVRVSAGIALASAQPLPPDKAAEQNRIRRFIREFVAGLSEQQRQIVRLHFIERLGQESTAEALSINRNRVRKQIRAIRQKLWKRLKREGLDRALPFSLDTLEARS